MSTVDFEKLERLYRASVRSFPKITDEQATEILSGSGQRRHAADTIFDSLVLLANTGVSVGSLHQASRHFYLADMLAGRGRERADVFSALAAHIPSVIQPNGKPLPSGPVTKETEAVPHVPAYLKSLDEKAEWMKALLVARACAVKRQFAFSTARTMAVANAAIAMKRRGYRFSIVEGRIEIQEKEIIKIVGHIETRLAKIGTENALKQLILMATRFHKWGYGQILFGHHHAQGLGVRDPLPPIGLLFNLAMKQPFGWDGKADIEKVWPETVELSRDFCALFDLESYTQFDNWSVDAPNLERKLREIAIYDNLFRLRQWHFEFTKDFIITLFGFTYDGKLKDKFGWNVKELISFCDILEPVADKMPRVFARSELYGKGLPYEVVSTILRDASYLVGEVNCDYTSPFKAAGQNAMFRPLLSVFDGRGLGLFSPCRSILGPALYEVAFSAIRQVVSSKVSSDIRGDGTERLARHIFAKYGFHPSIAGKSYNLKDGSGECDLVYEDDDEIILVECKAKALTRGAMAGVPADAMLDFAGSLVASQAQSLRHERMLRVHGRILFEDGTVLDHKDRRITRLSISLTDQGTLQDRWMLNTCYQALIMASLTCPPGYPKKKQVDQVNDSLRLLQEETRALVDAGHDLRAHSLNVGSASIAQLDIMLEEAQSLGDVRKFMALPANYNTGNPLLQHFHQAKLREYAQQQEPSVSQSSI